MTAHLPRMLWRCPLSSHDEIHHGLVGRQLPVALQSGHTARMNRASIARWWARQPGVDWLSPTPLLAAVALLSFSYPLSIWAASDYSLDSLSGAINLAYRLGDRTLYPAPSMG